MKFYLFPEAHITKPFVSYSSYTVHKINNRRLDREIFQGPSSRHPPTPLDDGSRLDGTRMTALYRHNKDSHRYYYRII